MYILIMKKRLKLSPFKLNCTNIFDFWIIRIFEYKVRRQSTGNSKTITTLQVNSVSGNPSTASRYMLGSQRIVASVSRSAAARARSLLGHDERVEKPRRVSKVHIF